MLLWYHDISPKDKSFEAVLIEATFLVSSCRHAVRGMLVIMSTALARDNAKVILARDQSRLSFSEIPRTIVGGKCCRHAAREFRRLSGPTQQTTKDKSGQQRRNQRMMHEVAKNRTMTGTMVKKSKSFLT
jgi:hypothetical protein